MACKRNFSDNPEIARLQRKFDQASELMCLALQDGDSVDATKHKADMERYRALIREALSQ